MNTKQLRNMLLVTTMLSGCSAMPDKGNVLSFESMVQEDIQLDKIRGSTHASPMEAMVERAMYKPGRLLGEPSESGVREIYYTFDGPKSLAENWHSKKSLGKEVSDEMKDKVLKSFGDIEAIANVKFIEKAPGQQAKRGYKGAHLDISLMDWSTVGSQIEVGNAYPVNEEGRSFIQLNGIAEELTIKHEILHSMGFSHSHKEGDKPQIFPEMDTALYTLMSYNNGMSYNYADKGGWPLKNQQSDEVDWKQVDYDKIHLEKTSKYTESLGAIDVYLLQEKYGASEEFLKLLGGKINSDVLQTVLSNKDLHPFLDFKTAELDALSEKVNVTQEVRAMSSVERILAERVNGVQENGRG